MDSERWQVVEPFLDRALELPSDEARSDWLAQLHAERPDVADEIRSLLLIQRAAAADRFLEHAVDLPGGRATAGQTIGAYKLVSPIGQGGMGSVWLAERSDGRFDRPAALKFLHVALAGRGEQRFKREGQFLGRLTHPHIANLLDAGISPEGRAYLVLEYVEGFHIDQYCDQHGLDVKARVRLFLDVLDAVAHAHANLIVHRDIKPSNVLVSTSGQVKLLDFGIAKLLEDDHGTADRTQLTREGRGPMTPEYASPEQVRGEVPTTGTDIYSAGAVLYKLLTGSSPHVFAGEGPGDLLAAIGSKDPAPASRLNRAVPRDLDYVLGKALRKEPGERYASVGAFADDLRAFLDWRPVSARSGSAWYRTRRLVRQYRLPLAAVALTIVALSVGLFIANHQRAMAQRRFVQVRQLANRFIELDEELRGIAGTTQVRSRIVSDSLQYLAALGSEIQGNRELALDIANAYVRVAHAQGDPTSSNLGQFAEAEASLEAAERFVQPIVAADPANARAVAIAAEVAHDRLKLIEHQGRRGAVLERAAGTAAVRVDALANVARREPSYAYAAAFFYGGVAGAYHSLRRFDDAVRTCRKALDLTDEFEPARRMRGNCVALTAIVLRDSGDLDGALKMARESVTLQEQRAAGGHSTSRENLANALFREGRILAALAENEPSAGRAEEALVVLRRALDISEEHATQDPHDGLSRGSVAKAALDIGNILRPRDPQVALAMYDKGLTRIREAQTSETTQRLEAMLLAMSSYAARALQRRNEAKDRIDTAFRRLRDLKLYPADRIEPWGEVDRTVRALADHYADVGPMDKAVATYQELLTKLMAWKLDIRNDIRDATCVSRTWLALGTLLRRAGRPDEAAALDARRIELANHWSQKLPGNMVIFRLISGPS